MPLLLMSLGRRLDGGELEMLDLISSTVHGRLGDASRRYASDRLNDRFRRRRPVGCELQFKPLQVAEINHGSAFSNENRPGERAYVPFYRFVRRAVLRRVLGEHGPDCNIL